MVKDLRTSVEVGNTQSVLDGDIDELYAKSSRANNLLEWKPAYSTLKSILQTSWSVYSKNI